VRAQAPGNLTGVYDGKYTCGQGPTYLKLSVAVSPIGDVSALFTFYLPADHPTEGYTYSLHGQFDPPTGHFSLTPVRWETEHGANLGMVGMDGAVSGDRLSGRITGGRCTTFDLTRNNNESATLTAVIAAQKNGGKPITPSTWTATLAAAQASATVAQTSPPTQAAAPSAPPASQTSPPPAVVPPAAPNAPLAARPEAKPPVAAPQAGAPPAQAIDLTAAYDPVLKWHMGKSREDDAAPHPLSSMFLDENDLYFNDLGASVNCNQNGMSVIFEVGGLSEPVFVYYEDSYGDYVSDVEVTVDGRSHVAKGFPKEPEDELVSYVDTLGLFFYKPDLAQQGVISREQQFRTGTDLDRLIGPLARAAAEVEVSDAEASAGGPLTDLLNAKSIRVEFSIDGWDDKPFVDLNPRDAVLHKFVADCAAKLGVGTAPATTAPGAPRTPPAQPTR
jgi:hypothetical protein